jgi:hypothetical protein
MTKLLQALEHQKDHHAGTNTTFGSSTEIQARNMPHFEVRNSPPVSDC